MLLLCFAGKHAARPSEIWNHGLYFSSCRRCGCDMIRAGKDWEPVPQGFKIVWRRAERPDQAGREEVIRNLPMVLPQSSAEAAPATVRIATARLVARRSLSLAQLVFLGVELLALYGADGFRTWRKNVAAKRLQRHTAVLLLTR